MAAHSLIASKPSKISLPRQPFALRHVARDAEGHFKIQLRSHSKPRNDEKQVLEKAQAQREHQKQRELQDA